jgi:hypothetical protein
VLAQVSSCFVILKSGRASHHRRMAKSTIEKIQKILDTEPDGIWGPKSQGALNTQINKTAGKGNPKLRRVQTILGVDPDGFWGPKSQAALNNEVGNHPGFSVTASSFADPADVVAFEKCKAQGKTDQECFKVGDNGIGQFGKITAQEHTAMVAVHADDMKTRWGSIIAAAHRPVIVTVNDKTIDATVEDRIGVKDRIDLNPAAAKALGLKPPFLVPCVWNWA